TPSARRICTDHTKVSRNLTGQNKRLDPVTLVLYPSLKENKYVHDKNEVEYRGRSLMSTKKVVRKTENRGSASQILRSVSTNEAFRFFTRARTSLCENIREG